MEFIHFANESISNNVKSNGIQVKDNFQGLGILAFPLTKISFKAPNCDYESEENKANLNLSIEQAWEVIGGSEIRQNNEQVYGIVFNLNS